MGGAAGEGTEMDVGQVGALAATRIDHDHRAVGVVRDRLQDPARLGEAVRLPRVLAPEHGDLGVFVVAGGVTARLAEQLAVDPELARLLLSECVRVEPDAERSPRRRPVPAAEVVALSPAAVEHDLLAAVFVDDIAEAGGALGARRVPVDRFVGAVGATPHR